MRWKKLRAPFRVEGEDFAQLFGRRTLSGQVKYDSDKLLTLRDLFNTNQQPLENGRMVETATCEALFKLTAEALESGRNQK